MLDISWTKLPLIGQALTDRPTALHRSSHSLAVVNDKAYIFGGENQPRTPVDDLLYIVDLKDGSTTTSSSSVRPSARVGSFLTADAAGTSLYLWGGRESKEMTPCDSSLWVYDIPGDEWAQIVPKGEDEPEQRSYHCMAVLGNELFLHAGCPSKGRLDTLHSLPLPASPSNKWTTLPAAPPPGRGGTVICPLTLPSGQDVLLRYGGFAGYELGGTLDIYEPSSQHWSSLVLPEDNAPDPRSVHALVPFTSATDPGLVALLLFGERDPAPVELGHNGAGKFHDDVWALRFAPENTGDGALGNGFSFERVSDGGPEPRGWFGAGVWHRDGDRVVVHGGLNGKNERLADFWIGQVKQV